MERSILFVDDERPILKALQRAFLETDYQIYMANSGKEALDILINTRIDLVISDMRMPNMDGHQLLLEIKRQYPTIIRVILSGYSEEKQVFRSLIDGSSKLYIIKPWDNDELIQIVQNVFEIQEIFKQNKILQIVNEIDGLPTLVTVYNKLRELIAKEADIKEISKLIENDPALGVKVLKFANSAFYGNKTGSIKQAIVYLGLAVIKDLILAVSVFDSDTSKKDHQYRLMLWKHAGICNRLVAVIYEQVLNKKLSDTGSTAGLLHDIGRVFMLQHFSQYYTLFCHKPENEVLASDKEKEIYGINHQELGAYLLSWWELPYPIVEAALYHHMPLSCTQVNKELICAVHIADYYAWKLLKQEIAILDERVFEYLGVSKEKCFEILDKVSI